MQDLIIRIHTPSGVTFSRAKATSKEDFIKDFNERVFTLRKIATQTGFEPPISVTIGGCEIKLDYKSEVFTLGEFLRFADGKNDPSTKLN